MATNNFKAFALDPNANVTSQADWEALPALLSGFTAGKASSAQVNKAIRQASFIAAALAQYTANKSGLDVLDDGDLNGFISKMGTAFGKDFQALDATLSALAGLATGANKLPYFTGNDTAAQTDLTSVGRDIIGKNTIADILTYLGLGEAAKRNVGTGANQIPDMSAYSSGSGWQKLPDGSIEQWGRINFPTNAAAVSTNVTFPIPFTQEPDIVIVYDGGFGGGNMWGATNWTRTGFVAHCNYGFEGGAFFAKGR
ncbi:phage tail protein [Escherichia coli]|uniref:gp53-like domain-containing protein n=2 Tax=Escherichia coli TaxID=562 RepID=UPI002350399F|nr:phage tail protein [Escherichia coli]MDC7907380.1 phage tail protein [Escherichia coli]